MQQHIAKTSWAAALGFAICVFLAPPAHALDQLIEGAKLCTRHLPRYEREYGIPTHLLSAIASTESGRYHEGLGIRIPWPWTINAQGKGYYFDSKQQAINAVRKLQARGVQSVDVGCMQVNLFHHPNAFSSLDDAFEPQRNIAYAASFLRGLYQEEGSWKKASADYHSKTPMLGNQYAGQVYSSWYQILDKLRLAKLQVPAASLAAASEAAPAPYVRRVDAMIAEHKAAPLPEQVGRKLAQFHSPRMNVIQLSKKDTEKENGVMIVRPEMQPAAKAASVLTPAEDQPLTVAQAKPAADPTPATDAHIIRVNSTSSAAPVKKSGPTFIFND